jgi:hypothetical protein
MKKYFLKYISGDNYVKEVEAESAAKAKIMFCKSENINPLICCDRIQEIRKPTEYQKRIAILIK